ncbi:MAG: PBP1A family penicillin-binding protein [Acidobacteriota bacterium]
MARHGGSGARGNRRHLLFWASYLLLAVGCAVAGGVAGLLVGYAVDLPRVEELENQQPSLVTYVYSADGKVIGQFASEKRQLVTWEQIPERLKQAVLAAEDANFFKHPGVDLQRVIATAFWDVVRWERKGGSTLTMQLAKLRFTSTEKSLERKIKDALYALNIEKNYSKEQIFTFYANQIPLGHGRYGFAAAADFYFHKPLDQLTLAECAVLAGIIQAPARQSPILYPERALARRSYVLRRMLEVGFIGPEEFRQAMEEPLAVKGRDDQQSPAPYFVEWVRRHLESRYRTEEIWAGGLKVYTTLDYDIQLAAEKALRNGLREFDRRRRGWAGAERNLVKEGIDIASFRHPDWDWLFYDGQLVHGVVVESGPDSATVKLGTFTARIGRDQLEWTRRKRVDEVLKVGDVAVFELVRVNRTDRTIEARLDQIPEVQGAVMVLDNRTGAVRAMVGGFDFQYSKFNRAVQALRQPGSIFKPFTYAAAMEAGYSPEDQVLDTPVTFHDALGRPYVPSNWDDEYKGLITIRQALAESRNIPTVRLAHALGPEKIAEMAKRFGLKQNFPPYLSIALGSVEVTLAEIVSAFSSFPNHGVRAEPFYVTRVEDSNGVILEEHRGQVHDAVVSPEVADKMLYLMQEVIRSGSGRSLLELGRPLGGKTGTTNESTDTWFVGFTPTLTAGVWVGYDEKRSLGEKMFGNNLALPIWKAMMTEVLKDTPVEQFESSWSPPAGHLVRQVDAPEAPAPEPRPAARRTTIEVEDIAPPPIG